MKIEKTQMDQVFRALGDPHRLQILDLLMEREQNAGELLQQVNVVQSTLSHHMKSLCESGLVRARKAGKWTYYSVDSWVVEMARRFLGKYLQEETDEPTPSETPDLKSAAPEGTVKEPERPEAENESEIRQSESQAGEEPKNEREIRKSEERKGKQRKKGSGKKSGEKKDSGKKKEKGKKGEKKKGKKHSKKSDHSQKQIENG